MGIAAMFDSTWSEHQTGFVVTAVEEMEIEAKEFMEQHFGKPVLSLGYV
jgi:hypothetical protein